MSKSSLIKAESGVIKITGLRRMKWSSASPVSLNFTRGEGIWHPELEAVVNLSEAPEYTELTLTTAALISYITDFDAWVAKHRERKSTDLSAAGDIEGLSYTFTQCSLSRVTVFPGIEKNPGGGQSVKRLELVLNVGDVSLGKQLSNVAA